MSTQTKETVYEAIGAFADWWANRGPDFVLESVFGLHKTTQEPCKSHNSSAKLIRNPRPSIEVSSDRYRRSNRVGPSIVNCSPQPVRIGQVCSHGSQMRDRRSTDWIGFPVHQHTR